MTMEKKKEIISHINIILNEILLSDEEVISQRKQSRKNMIERADMVTIRECAKTLDNVSEYTIRKLVNQDKIPHIRIGDETNAKILICKSDVIDYLDLL